MHRHLALIASAALLGAAACSKPSAPADDLRRDLDMANGSGLELAPRSTGTQVVSDLEQAPRSAPAKAAVQRAPAPRPTPRAAPRPAPVPTPRAVEVAEAPAVQAPEPTPVPAPAPSEVIATPRPMPAPQGAPQRRGGYSSVSDVLRRAPFPVTP